MGDVKDPYMYAIEGADLTDNLIDKVPNAIRAKLIYMPYDDKDKAYRYLAYLPSWEDNQTVTIVLKSNQNTPKIEIKPLTFNLGQSIPNSFNKEITSIKLDWDTSNFYVDRVDKDNHPVGRGSVSYPTDVEKPPAIEISKLFEYSSTVNKLFDYSALTSTVGAKTLNVSVGINMRYSCSKPLVDGVLPYEAPFIDTKVVTNVDVPVTVQLGNALDFKASYNHHNFSLVSDWNSDPDKFYIKALLAGAHSNTIIHPSYATPYYSIGYYSGSGNLSLTNNPSEYVSINGIKTAGYAVNALGVHTFNKSDTNIIKVYHAEVIAWTNTFHLITNNKSVAVKNLVTPSLINNNTFFEMTADGYKLLTLNQLTSKNNQSIFKNASHTYLDTHVKEFIDIDRYPGLSVRWSEYPDTSTEGAKTGKLLVTQKSSTGKDLTYEYPVNVNVVPGSVQLQVSDIAHFDDITIDGKAKLIKSPDFNAKIIDTRYVRGNDLNLEHRYPVEATYNITAKIADKNENLAPYLSYTDVYYYRDVIKQEPGFNEAVNSDNEDELYNFMVKKVPKIIDTIDYSISPIIYADLEGEPLTTYLFTGRHTDSFDEELLGHGLAIAIPENAPLKPGKYSATISWDIAEVP
ncbi:hypothetical protein [Enterococcus sp. DIV1420a]|uniref:hypothetical protein n=1 Tax=Enterococcus sp. DIV1420a TaxID=2774672 RepID=UPI003F68754D